MNNVQISRLTFAEHRTINEAVISGIFIVLLTFIGSLYNIFVQNIY